VRHIQNSSTSDHSFDAIYCVGEEQRGVRDGTVRDDSCDPVKRFKWPVTEGVYDTSLEEVFVPHVTVSYTTRQGKRTQYTLACSLRDNSVVAHHRFLKRYI